MRVQPTWLKLRFRPDQELPTRITRLRLLFLRNQELALLPTRRLLPLSRLKRPRPPLLTPLHPLLPTRRLLPPARRQRPAPHLHLAAQQHPREQEQRQRYPPLPVQTRRRRRQQPPCRLPTITVAPRLELKQVVDHLFHSS